MTNIFPIAGSDRKLGSWIAGFAEFTEGMSSPLIFRKWAAVAAIAGTLERKVWIRSQRENIYPNMYIFLAGPPGSGKTRALKAAWNLWNTLEKYHVAEISLTKAALIDRLAISERRIGALEVFHSLLVAAPELGALLPAYDAEFMNTLTHLYDGIIYSERRRSAKTEFAPIERPCINLIACTTPGFLSSGLPPSAWNEGFLSRVCIAYSGEITIKPFDLEEKEIVYDAQLKGHLEHDLDLISKAQGKFTWTREASTLAEDYNRLDFDLWKDFKGEDGKIEKHAVLAKPNHPRLLHYCTRRPLHFLKLCIICAADRGEMIIDLADVDSAIDLMYGLEQNMSDVFTAMQSGGDAQIISDTQHWIMTENARNGDKGVPMHMVHEFLSTRAPATHISRIFEVMISAGTIRMLNNNGNPIVKTKPKKP